VCVRVYPHIQMQVCMVVHTYIIYFKSFNEPSYKTAIPKRMHANQKKHMVPHSFTVSRKRVPKKHQEIENRSPKQTPGNRKPVPKKHPEIKNRAHGVAFNFASDSFAAALTYPSWSFWRSSSTCMYCMYACIYV
jgi:hypothetical protein